MTCPQLRRKTRTSISRKICCVKSGFQILYAVEQFSSLFCFKDTKNLAALSFFLAACKKKFQRANATDIVWDENDPPDDWLKTGWARDSQTRLVDSLICINCSLENNTSSVLHFVMVALHHSMGLFTWRWGTPGRWGNLLRWGKKITLLYMQSYNPAIPGCTFSRLLNGR